MVIVRIFGGLGNQMFQYAFGYYLEKNGNDVYYDISDFSIHNHHHGYELESVFNLYVKKASTEKIKEMGINKNSIFSRVIKKITEREFVSENEVIQRGAFEFIMPTFLNDSLYFNGYWQDVRYVKPYINELKEIFSFPELDKRNREIILKGGEYVGVHVRRGDYLNAPNLNGICDMSYYEDAIKYIYKNVDNPKFVIFSDDIGYSKKVFENYDCIYIDWNKGKESFKDMQLMSMCDHMITANSSFSWWGAMLTQNEKGIKIAPSKRSRKENLNALIDESWVTINTEGRKNG